LFATQTSTRSLNGSSLVIHKYHKRTKKKKEKEKHKANNVNRLSSD